MKLVGRSPPFQRKTVLETKLVPVTVSISGGAPARVLCGEIAVIVGAGLPMVKPASMEAPPPGGGLTASISVIPALVSSLAGTIACKRVLLVKVVGRLAPFHCNTVPETKLVPVAESVISEDPTTAFCGERAVMDGTGFPTVNTTPLEAPPPGEGLKT